MQLTPGFKQSEAGVIPEDWDAVLLGSLASFQSGTGISIASLHKEASSDLVPVYGGNGIAGYTRHALVREPTVVVGRVGQKCGEVYITDGPAWITDNALYPRAFYRAIDVRFLALALRVAGLNDVKNRNDLPLVTQSILHSVFIPVPSTVREQEAIAETLRHADALIESLDQVIAKKRQLKQGAMQELLTGERRLPGFSGEWNVRLLGSLGTFLKGRGVTKAQALSGHLRCVRYGEIYTRHHDHIRSYYSWISPAVAVTATRLVQGDVLFAGSGETKEEIGKCVAFVDDVEAYAGGDIVILRSEKADPTFLGYYLNSEPVKWQKASRGQGDAVVHIRASELAEIEVCIPSVDEQTAIAAVLSDMDAEIAVLEEKLSKARQIKQGMMQELLTGRIRLVRPEPAAAESAALAGV